MTRPYLPPIEAPDLSEVQAWTGWSLLEFGTDWCGHCRAAQPPLAEWLADSAGVPKGLQHVKVEDGSGRALGRHFKVKLWPTLVLLRDGQEVARVVRPTQRADLQPLLAQR